MKRLFGVIMIIFILIFSFGYTQAEKTDLWSLYDSVFKKCKYVDLTHAFSPTISVWPGFGNAKFKPTLAGADMPGYIVE